ncbi:SWIM zinc finger family protein [Inhella crocodyli]|uniref:SWIM-type domain-containing protein n=1 Tax=Inhella crocodyli TaxID=2499851 RepID=A0A437LTL6_9BURK|nr:SWIM zinc finger family protein [Inhella crocodyli]RVT88750.1 hypothetical protein EOD73_07220 [Inhella crocodyli]
MRTDLLPLGPEALIQFTNAGLVKRALRELAGGYRPALALDDAATLSARFDDGVEVQWPQGLSIAQSRCNCGANGVCRHRLIAVLAYREQVPADAAPATAALESVSDAELAAALSPAVLQEAERARAAGLRVELRGRADGEPCDTARLPSATVRYWAGGALAAARCDCLRGSACAHVALGLWAFRAAQGARSVQLGALAAARALDRLPFVAAVDTLLRLGVTHGSGALGQALSQARAASREAAWLALLVAELESWSEAYARRSARYDAADGVDLLAELALRLAAGGQPGQAAAVLGLGQSGETLLDRLRLMTLGARTRRDGAQRQTELVLADLDTGTRLVLRHDWTPPEGSDAATEAQQRARERLAPGLGLEALAQGQLLAQAAARRPDGSLRLARARSSQNSVLPQTADWQLLGPPVRFDAVAALRREASASPIAALQPRHAARRFVVFTPAPGAVDIAYDPQTQTLLATVEDANGDALGLQRTHQGHLPWALDSLAAGLAGCQGPLRHVAGLLSWQDGQPWLEPWALACDQVLVPDFASQPTGALAHLPLGRPPPADPSAPAEALERLRQHLGQALHTGLAQVPARWAQEGEALAGQLEQRGFSALAARLRPLPGLTAGVARAEAWLQLLALLQLHRDAATQAAFSDEAPLDA